jgi:hypothetical protein
MTSVTFATFCHAGDALKLHAPGQLRKQVESNSYAFDEILVMYQLCNPDFYKPLVPYLPITQVEITDIDDTLRAFEIDIDKPQYISPTDKIHRWKYHVVNHLKAISEATTDYIVFADADCWMVSQLQSWVQFGIEKLEADKNIFIVSPNDGEPERLTRRMSQQMFMARVEEFRRANFNQPRWDGNVNISGGPLPEYWAMLEGRMELHCRVTNQWRYVCPPEYRYWHHNKITTDGLFETDYSKW